MPAHAAFFLAEVRIAGKLARDASESRYITTRGPVWVCTMRRNQFKKNVFMTALKEGLEDGSEVNELLPTSSPLSEEPQSPSESVFTKMSPTSLMSEVPSPRKNTFDFSRKLELGTPTLLRKDGIQKKGHRHSVSEIISPEELLALGLGPSEITPRRASDFGVSYPIIDLEQCEIGNIRLSGEAFKEYHEFIERDYTWRDKRVSLCSGFDVISEEDEEEEMTFFEFIKS